MPTHNFIDMAGKRFGLLTVISRYQQNSKKNGAQWLCRCDCGVECIKIGDNLRSGTRSCGCLHLNKIAKGNPKHGHAVKGHESPTYRSWLAMLTRCTNPVFPSFKRYGGRGITVCERWLKFQNFLADMGERPAGRTLERRDNNGPYLKENCRWATAAEQSRNTRRNRFMTYQGRTLCVTDWAKELGMPRERLKARLESGWTVERALGTP